MRWTRVEWNKDLSPVSAPLRLPRPQSCKVSLIGLGGLESQTCPSLHYSCRSESSLDLPSFSQDSSPFAKLPASSPQDPLSIRQAPRKILYIGYGALLPALKLPPSPDRAAQVPRKTSCSQNPGASHAAVLPCASCHHTYRHYTGLDGGDGNENGTSPAEGGVSHEESTEAQLRSSGPAYGS